MLSRRIKSIPRSFSFICKIHSTMVKSINPSLKNPQKIWKNSLCRRYPPPPQKKNYLIWIPSQLISNFENNSSTCAFLRKLARKKLRNYDNIGLNNKNVKSTQNFSKINNFFCFFSYGLSPPTPNISWIRTPPTTKLSRKP